MRTSTARVSPPGTRLGLVIIAILLLGVGIAPCQHGPQPEVEPNNTPATATVLVPEDWELWFFGVPGAISPAGDVDYFQIPVQAGNRLWLLVDTGGTTLPGATSRDSVLEVLAPDGSTVLEQDDDDGTGNGHGMVISSLDASAIAGLVAPSTGSYFLRVAAKNPTDVIAPYVLMVGMSTTTPGPETEPNDTMGQAQSAWLSVLGSLSSDTDLDWYDLNLMDAGVPFVIVDGDPERDGISTDVMIDFEPGWPMPQVNSSTGSGSPPPPAEALVLPGTPHVCLSGPDAGTYLLFVPYTGDGVPVPVELMSLEVR